MKNRWLQLTLYFFTAASVLAGSHVRSTDVVDGYFYYDASKDGIYRFESIYGPEVYDLSGKAFLTSSGAYPPEIPGLRDLNIGFRDGKLDIHEKDAKEIAALAEQVGGGVRMFRAADQSLFYIRTSGKTHVRKITIESEGGDSVNIWRNLPDSP